MNDTQQRSRRNNYIMGQYYDQWKLMNQDDEDEEKRLQAERLEFLDRKSERIHKIREGNPHVL